MLKLLIPNTKLKTKFLFSNTHHNRGCLGKQTCHSSKRCCLHHGSTLDIHGVNHILHDKRYFWRDPATFFATAIHLQSWNRIVFLIKVMKVFFPCCCQWAHCYRVFTIRSCLIILFFLQNGGECSAYNCMNHSNKHHRMVRFYEDPERRKMWISNCRKKNWTSGERAQLCIVSNESQTYETKAELVVQHSSFFLCSLVI